MKRIGFLAIAGLLFACGQATEQAAEASTDEVVTEQTAAVETEEENTPSTGSFGDEITEEGAVTPAEYLPMME